MIKFTSIEHKLLLAFAAFLLVVTALNAGLASFLINSQGEADAFSRLSRQLLFFRNGLQDAREAEMAVALNAARDEKNLSDLAVLYSQTLKLGQTPGETLDFTLGHNKITSLNRLQLILLSARFSSVAVYLNGELSHYVTPDEAGMVMQRSGQPSLRATRQQAGGRIQLTDWWSWQEIPPPVHIARSLPRANQVTGHFDFPAEHTMVMQVRVPIQGVSRESFGETIVESLGIATPAETPADGAEEPAVIGMFVFSRVFDRSFLEETASRSGVIPAIYSADGQHRVQLVERGGPSRPVLQQTDDAIRLQTVTAGSTSYYQAYMPWPVEASASPLMLSLALSRESTAKTIQHTVGGIIAMAVVILLVGGAIGYVLIARLTAPIKTLTTTVARMVLRPEDAGTPPPGQPIASQRPAEVNIGAGDEVGQLTTAFNVMTEQLHQSLETLEQRVAERTTQLEAANKELEAFSYSVSHDLRAPLRHIDGYLALLQETAGPALDAESLQHLRTIADAARHMSTLIDDLLSFSRMGRQAMRKTPVDLGALVADVVRGFAPEIEGRDIDWHIAPLPVVAADCSMLRVVLVNLISNALKYTSKRPQARIEIGTQPGEPGETVIFVRDNGAGFDMRFQDKLFGVFQRLHRIDEFDGIGIGLANVLRVIERHGGRTWANGKVDAGATFYFALPNGNT
jgi:signal transduction histidine kinase